MGLEPTNLLITNQLLYRLSYASVTKAKLYIIIRTFSTLWCLYPSDVGFVMPLCLHDRHCLKALLF